MKEPKVTGAFGPFGNVRRHFPMYIGRDVGECEEPGSDRTARFCSPVDWSIIGTLIFNSPFEPVGSRISAYFVTVTPGTQECIRDVV